jgi:hypothetical protein
VGTKYWEIPNATRTLSPIAQKPKTLIFAPPDTYREFNHRIKPITAFHRIILKVKSAVGHLKAKKDYGRYF